MGTKAIQVVLVSPIENDCASFYTLGPLGHVAAKTAKISTRECRLCHTWMKDPSQKDQQTKHKRETF
jgi:hypothetical protein